MCSRYYIDPDMMEEISRVVQNIDGRIRLTQGDIRPTDVAPVIGQSEHNNFHCKTLKLSSSIIFVFGSTILEMLYL